MLRSLGPAAMGVLSSLAGDRPVRTSLRNLLPLTRSSPCLPIVHVLNRLRCIFLNAIATRRKAMKHAPSWTLVFIVAALLAFGAGSAAADVVRPAPAMVH